jgi:hypothetical protein
MTRPFNSAALPKCHDRLNKSKEAFGICRNAMRFGEFASGWAAFLIHTGSVINALEAGAQHTPQGRQWYGRIKREGRKDPLVSYMYQARNSEEHSTDNTTHPEPGRFVISGDFTIERLVMQIGGVGTPGVSGRIRARPGGRPIAIEHTPSGPRLIPVVDSRFGTTFDVPKEHLGKPLQDDSPLAVAELYLEYLEDIVRKAEMLS